MITITYGGDVNAAIANETLAPHPVCHARQLGRLALRRCGCPRSWDQCDG